MIYNYLDPNCDEDEEQDKHNEDDEYVEFDKNNRNDESDVEEDNNFNIYDS